MYFVKEIKNIANLLTITVSGNGDGLKKDLILEDNLKNKFLIKEIAMTGDFSETTLSVIQLKSYGRIGNILERVGDCKSEEKYRD